MTGEGTAWEAVSRLLVVLGQLLVSEADLGDQTLQSQVWVSVVPSASQRGRFSPEPSLHMHVHTYL